MEMAVSVSRDWDSQKGHMSPHVVTVLLLLSAPVVFGLGLTCVTSWKVNELVGKQKIPRCLRLIVLIIVLAMVNVSMLAACWGLAWPLFTVLFARTAPAA